MGHYSIDVDVDQLSSAKTGLSTLGTHLTTHSEQASATPGEIGSSWTGTAATAIKAEMTGLGTQTKAFAPKFSDAAEAIGVFITAIGDAQDTIDSLNRQYDKANQDCTDAINKAQRAHDQSVGELPADDSAGRRDADSTLGSARGNAATGLRYTLQGLQYGYTEAVETLRTAAKTLGTSLRAAVVLPVPDETVTAYEKGSVPSDLLAKLHRAGVDALGGDLHLTHDRQEQSDGKKAAEDFKDFAGEGPRSDEEIQAYLDRLHIDSEAFRQSFLDNMDPQSLVFLQEVAHTGASSKENSQKYGEVITAISRMMALGSNEKTQGTYPVRADFYDDWRKAAQDWDQGKTGKGYLFIAEIVQAGQGEGATWDSALLTDITDETIAFERKMKEENPGFTWAQALGNGLQTWPTAAGRSLVGDVPGQADALAMLFDALGEDPTAAQDVLTDGNHKVDKDLLHYLYDGREAQGNWLTWGSTLGETLDAATSFVGAGGEGTRDYASADIVSDLVHFYGTHMDRYPITMDQYIVNILSHHVQALNYAGSDAEGSVGGNHPDGLLEHQRIALANLATGDLANLLKGVFGEDYYAQHGDSADPSKGFPMYQQLSAAQHAAFRRDFLDITSKDPLDQGRLEQLAFQQGHAETDLAHNLRDALTAQGASKDQADADAKAAVDFVLGLGIDKLPIDKLGGAAGTVGGLAVDGIKDAALNAIFPDRDYAGQANAEGLDIQQYLRKVVPLEYVSMLDEAGVLKGDDSPAAWAAAHPGESSFMQNGHLVDLADLYAHRADHPEKWNDFLYYYEEHGQSALNDLDLNEQFDLGFLTSDDDHGGSGD